MVRKSGVWSRHIWSSNRRVGFSTKLVGKLTAMLRLLTVRRIVSQKVQLLKIYTSELPAFMQFFMFVEFHLTSISIQIKAGMNGRLEAGSYSSMLAVLSGRVWGGVMTHC